MNFVLPTGATCVAGHSLGEYSALTAAGSLTLTESAKLLRIRGSAMQAAVPQGQGGMVAIIGPEFSEVEAIVREARARARTEVIEIANARKESYAGAGGKGKGYKPEDVSPATIEEDVFRREFTFNTMLWRLLDLAEGPDKAEIIDITGLGQKHLKEKLLQTPRDPDIVFGDDPTRILRLLKFQARYNLKIPSNVADSVRRNAPKMKNMPWEAIGTILVNDILSSPAARRALGIMVDLDIIPVIREMVLESKPFATFLARQLRENRNVQLLLDLADLGMSASTPVSFLSPKQVQRLREITITMDEDDANRFVSLLQQPPIDNMALIEEFQIPANQRKNLMFLARESLLASPHLALFPERLTQAVRERL